MDRSIELCDGWSIEVRCPATGGDHEPDAVYVMDDREPLYRCVGCDGQLFVINNVGPGAPGFYRTAKLVTLQPYVIQEPPWLT